MDRNRDHPRSRIRDREIERGRKRSRSRSRDRKRSRSRSRSRGRRRRFSPGRRSLSPRRERRRSRSPGRERRRSRSRSVDRHRRRTEDRKQDMEQENGNGQAETVDVVPEVVLPIMTEVALDAELTPEEIQMMQAMGIPYSFDSTQGKHVDDERANTGAVKVASTRRARQFMNRRGGFNRPLPPERTGEKVRRD